MQLAIGGRTAMCLSGVSRQARRTGVAYGGLSVLRRGPGSGHSKGGGAAAATGRYGLSRTGKATELAAGSSASSSALSSLGGNADANLPSSSSMLSAMPHHGSNNNSVAAAAGGTTGGGDFLNSTVQTETVTIVDLTGKASQQKVHSRIFDAYDAKSLILLLTPSSGDVGSDALLGGDAIAIDSWTAFLKFHRQGNTYQLVPRKARNTLAFLAAKALTEVPHSPFSLEHREDPFDFRYVFREPDQPAVKKWSQSNSDSMVFGTTIGHGVVFDCILNARDTCALILTADTFSERIVQQSICWNAYMKEWVSGIPTTNRYSELKTRWNSLLRKKNGVKLVVAAEKGTPVPQISALAAKHGVLLFARDGHKLKYVPPPPNVVPKASTAADAADDDGGGGNTKPESPG